jgi:hypothetical protein
MSLSPAVNLLLSRRPHLGKVHVLGRRVPTHLLQHPSIDMYLCTVVINYATSY